MEAMTEWLDYPQSEIESDVRLAAKVGGDELNAYVEGLAAAAVQPDHQDLVYIIVLALCTDGAARSGNRLDGARLATGLRIPRQLVRRPPFAERVRGGRRC